MLTFVGHKQGSICTWGGGRLHCITKEPPLKWNRHHRKEGEGKKISFGWHCLGPRKSLPLNFSVRWTVKFLNSLSPYEFTFLFLSAERFLTNYRASSFWSSVCLCSSMWWRHAHLMLDVLIAINELFFIKAMKKHPGVSRWATSCNLSELTYFYLCFTGVGDPRSWRTGAVLIASLLQASGHSFGPVDILLGISPLFTWL